MEDNNPEMNTKRNRNEDGSVKTAPRNFYTNQQTTVLRSYFRPVKYMEDPYERAHAAEVDYLKKQKSMEAEARLKLNLHPKDTFGTIKLDYGTDVEIPEVWHFLFRKKQRNRI
jgi:hypothetical protein